MQKKLATYICMLLVGMMGFFMSVHNTSLHNTNVYADEPGIGNATSYAQVQAVPGAKPPTPDTDMQKMFQSLVSALNIILDILTIIVTPAMILASWLMSPDWTSGDIFQIRPMIHDLWVVVANVTYFIYAILLIFIALATIFNSDKYGYKQLLPKLALGILLVPMSWWFIQFIISLSSVVTASVINIPTEVVINYTKDNKDSWWTKESIPKETKFDNEKKEDKKKVECTKDNCVSPQDFVAKAGGMYSNLMVYSFAVFRFQDVKILNEKVNTIKSIGQIINQGLIGAVMFIVYGLLVLALVFMLMMRAIKLWFYAIFSPLMTLKYVVGDGIFGKEGGETFAIKEFIGLAFVPALVGLALSFGLVIVSVMMTPPKDNSGKCSDTECTITLFGNAENTIVSKVEVVGQTKKTTTTVSVGGAKYIFTGDVSPGSATSTVKSALNATGGIIGTIILDIIALVFIWVAFMAAKNVSKAVSAVVKPFEEMGSKIGSMAMSLPKYAPILPGGISINGATKLVGQVESNIESSSNKKLAESKLGQLVGMDSELTTAKAKMAQAMKDTSSISLTGFEEIRKNAQQIVAKKGLEDPESQKIMMDLKTIAEKVPELKDKLNNKKLYESGGRITLAGEKLLYGKTSDSSGWDDHEADEKTVKERQKKHIVQAGAANNTASTFTTTDIKGTDKIDIRFTPDIKVQINTKTGDGIEATQLDTLRKFVKDMTVAEFANRFTGVDSGVVKKIEEKIGKESFKK